MKEVTKYFYKSIKFPLDKWNEIKELKDDLSAERGFDVSLPATVIEAVMHLKEHRAHTAAEKDD